MKEAPPRGVRFSILHRAMKKQIDDYMSSEGLTGVQLFVLCELRKLEKKNLDAAMLAALKQTNDFVLSQGKPLDPMSKAAYEDILACSGQNERKGTAESKGL